MTPGSGAGECWKWDESLGRHVKVFMRFDKLWTGGFAPGSGAGFCWREDPWTGRWVKVSESWNWYDKGVE